MRNKRKRKNNWGILILRNMIPAASIILAFILTFKEKAFGFEREQITLFILGLLAIDSILDRYGFLTDIEEHLKEIRDSISIDTKKIFGFRGDFGSSQDLIKLGRKELLVSGITLSSVAVLKGVFKEQLDRGVSVKLLALDPKNSLLKETSEFLGENGDSMKKKLIASLNDLHKELKEYRPDKVMIRVINHRLVLGYFIIDPHEDDGYMRAEHYFCRSEMIIRPMFQLFKKNDKHLFEAYVKDFENLWKMSNDYLPIYTKKSDAIESRAVTKKID